jgi:hypothetical protein
MKRALQTYVRSASAVISPSLAIGSGYGFQLHSWLLFAVFPEPVETDTDTDRKFNRMRPSIVRLFGDRTPLLRSD